MNQKIEKLASLSNHVEDLEKKLQEVPNKFVQSQAHQQQKLKTKLGEMFQEFKTESSPEYLNKLQNIA